MNEDAWFAAYGAGGVLEWTHVLDTVGHGLPDLNEAVEDMKPLPNCGIGVLVNHSAGVSNQADIVLRLDSETPLVPWLHLVDEDYLPTLGGPFQTGYSVRGIENITTDESGNIYASAQLINFGTSVYPKVRTQLAGADGSVAWAEVFQSPAYTPVAFARESDDLWVELARGAGAVAPEAWGRISVSVLTNWSAVGSMSAEDIIPDPIDFVPWGLAPLGDDAFVSFFHGLVDDPGEGWVTRAGVAVSSVDGVLESYTPIDANLARGLSAGVDSNGGVFARWGQDPEDNAPQLIHVDPDGSISFHLPREPGAPAIIDLAVGQSDGVIMLTESNTLVKACIE